MASEETPKKDLTSLVDLSALEMASNPESESAKDDALQMPAQEPIAEFESLEEMSKTAPEPTPELEAGPESLEMNSLSQINITMPEQAAEPVSEAAAEPLPEPAFEPAPEPILAVDSAPGESPQDAKPAPGFEQHFDPIDPNREPVHAAPVGSSHSAKPVAPATEKQDLSEVKRFGEMLSIGKPAIEASPAFSILVKSATGSFDEKTRKAIELAVMSEDFGVRMEDLTVQLSAGKLLVPQISEFAAITLAQKLRDAVDNIELDLAGEIFKSSAAEITSVDEYYITNIESFERHHEEVRDLAAEPANENELFSSNLSELAPYQVTRILSAVTASEVLTAEIAEDPTSPEFEAATERLTRQLISRAFKLGAHGVLGLNFALRAIEGFKDKTGRVGRAYRLLATGTAVRTRQRTDSEPKL